MATTVRAFNPARQGQRKRANPSHLLIVNGGKKKVATTKPKATNRGRKPNSGRAATVRSTPRKSNFQATGRYKATSRKPNPRRRPNRQRNPQLKGLVFGALTAAAGAMLTKTVARIIPIPGMSGWMNIALQFGIAFLTGWLAERFVSPQTAQLMAIGGAAGAAHEAISMLLTQAGGIFSPNPTVTTVQTPAGELPAAVGDYVEEWGMGDITTAPEYVLGDISVAPEVAYVQ